MKLHAAPLVNLLQAAKASAGGVREPPCPPAGWAMATAPTQAEASSNMGVRKWRRVWVRYIGVMVFAPV